MNDKIFNPIAFEMPKNQFNAIKVIGVGGGGSNAVNYMFQQEIHGVDFVICNTDAQALENSPIANKIQLGIDLTEGMGAGANPEIGAKAAQESYNELKEVLSSNTKMVFITAGMGGGTGTGAAPIIAKIAKELSLLTVGIVTMPFEFEGKSRINQAQKGIDKLREHVDSLIIINNNKLREVYGNLGYKSGFSKADEVLSTAAAGIAEVITHHYKQNIDLNDAKTVLSNSGSAIMGSASAKGKDRAKSAITQALDSPLLNDNKITGAKNVLLLIVSGKQEVTFDEIGEINDHIRNEAGNDVNIIMGIGDDEKLEDAIAVTIVATGFSSGQQHQITNTDAVKIVHTLDDTQGLLFDLSDHKPMSKVDLSFVIEDEDEEEIESNEPLIVHDLNEDIDHTFDFVITTEEINQIEVNFEEIKPTEINEFLLETEEKDFEKKDLDTIQVVEEETFFIDLVEESFQEKKHPLKQLELSFDLPAKNEETLSATTIEKKEVHEKEVLLFQHEIESEITYNLSDFEDNLVLKSSPSTSQTKTADLELQFELKSQVMEEPARIKDEISLGDSEVPLSPLNSSISEFKKTVDMRKNSMKQFNYKFNKNTSNIDEFEREPAYKRMNIELDEKFDFSDNIGSRTSVDIDENGIKLRTNNSYLHDNVD